MKYAVELSRHETRTTEVFAETPQDAAKLAMKDGFRAESVTELVGDDECGESFEVVGGCEGCGVPLVDTEYRSDAEGVTFCVKCFGELVADESAA